MSLLNLIQMLATLVTIYYVFSRIDELSEILMCLAIVTDDLRIARAWHITSVLRASRLVHCVLIV